jgi:hypothetical protein
LLAVELESAGYNRSLASRPGVFEAMQAEDFGVLEDGNVEVHGLLGVVVEPEEGSNFRHGVLQCFVAAKIAACPERVEPPMCRPVFRAKMFGPTIFRPTIV